MPITINGTTDSRVGYLQPTLGEFTANIDGTHSAPPDFAGSMNPTLGSFSVNFDGNFASTASFDGDFNVTLDGFNVNIIGNQIQNIDGLMSVSLGGFSVSFIEEETAPFATRVANLGLNHVNSINFSTAAELGAIDRNRLTRTPVSSDWNRADAETTIKASGLASLRQTIQPDDSINSAPDWGFNFGEDLEDLTKQPTQFPPSLTTPQMFGLKGQTGDLGDVMCIQWRQYWETDGLNIIWENSGRGGWKFLKIINGDYYSAGVPTQMSSDNNKELTFSNFELSNTPGCATGPSAVNIVGPGFNTNGDAFTDSYGRDHLGNSGDDTWQNAIPTSATAVNLGDTLSRFGMRTTDDFAGDAFQCSNPSNFGCNLNENHQMTYSGIKRVPPEYQAVQFVGNTRMTFQVRVTLGDLVSGNYQDSRFEFWGAEEGAASVKITDHVMDLQANESGVPSDQIGYGKLFFTPFHTGNLVDLSRPDFNTYIDEIIVSKELVVDPATGVLPPNSVDPGSSALDIAVASLAVNQWVEFNGSTDWPGGASSFWVAGGGSTESIIGWTHTGFHDSARGKVGLVGAGYGYTGFVVYDEATDAWSSSDHNNDPTHIWDHSAYDASTGTLYYGTQGGSSHYSTSVLTPGSYSSESAPWVSFQDTWGFEYFPDRDSVLARDRNGNIFERPTGGSWSSVASSTAPRFHSFMSYNPVDNLMYIGGGQGSDTDLFEISTGLTVSSSANNGSNPGVDCIRQHAMCGDVTGDLVVIDFPAGDVWGYTRGSGWSDKGTSFPSVLIDASARTAAIPLRGYGDREVFMCFRVDGSFPGNCYCYLYRYS